MSSELTGPPNVFEAVTKAEAGTAFLRALATETPAVRDLWQHARGHSPDDYTTNGLAIRSWQARWNLRAPWLTMFGTHVIVTCAKYPTGINDADSWTEFVVGEFNSAARFVIDDEAAAEIVEARWLELSAAKTKTAEARTIPIGPRLRAELEMRRHGPEWQGARAIRLHLRQRSG